MNKMRDTSYVSKQYSDDTKLQIRIALHDKYSVNKQGVHNWIFSNFKFFEGCKILELGCGAGRLWENHIESLPKNTELTLSDFSEGMVDIVQKKFAAYPNISAEKIDIQNINYPDDTFDFVIANHMLYHVPDLQKAISEVHRILKPQGIFYASTNGINGANVFMNSKLKEFNSEINLFAQENFSFTLQNGEEMLKSKFSEVKMYEYIDSLEITETKDLIDYMLSAIHANDIEESKFTGVTEFFENIRNQNGGVIKIRKESGMFEAVK